MYGLALSSLATHLISLTVPFLMSGFAYLLASMWIQTQLHGNVSSLPSPTQYGHLVSLCSSVSLGSVYDTAKYLSHRRRRPAPSTTLVAAFFATRVALVLTYALSASSDGSGPGITFVSPAVRSDFNTTSALLAALDSAYSGILAAQLTTTLRGSLNVTFDTFGRILAGNATQGILSYAAPLTERTSSIGGETVHSITVSRYPLAPLGVVLTLAYGYALLVLGVGVVGFCLPSRVLINSSTHDLDGGKPRIIRELDLVRLRFTSARASISDRFDEAPALPPKVGVKGD
ncbi:hypothetical protein C8R45DRAFT_1095297 [Mycena sanguinolenta]|nr:hypothetical protein C8R45DRAFT_1095297 [Mycena sanguinolenta]